jgi:hypothetical protein
MKKLLFLVVVGLTLNFNLFGQIQMNSDGNVGIGRSPSYSRGLVVSDGLTVSDGLSISGTLYFSYAKILGYYSNSIMESDHSYGGSKFYPGYNGYGSIGTPSKRWGYIYTRGLSYESDIRLKNNIEKINGCLDKVMKLEPIRYDIISPEFEDSLPAKMKEKRKIDNKNHLGLSAQATQKILPEVVQYDDSTDSYGIDYAKIIPVLIGAIQDQQGIIISLKNEIKELKNNSGSDGKLKSATVSDNSTDIQNNALNQTNTLYQNAPNPFSQSTTIEYSLAESVQKAMICIYNMNGTQLKCIPLNLTGYGNITINGNEFKSGMYMYSLLADGQLIDTKRMVLTD